MFGWDFEDDAWSRFWRWKLIKICVWICDMNSTLRSILLLSVLSTVEMLMFGWHFLVDAWSRIWRWNLIKICIWTCDRNSTLGSVVPLAMFCLHISISVFMNISSAEKKQFFKYVVCPYLTHPHTFSAIFSSKQFLCPDYVSILLFIVAGLYNEFDKIWLRGKEKVVFYSNLYW